jgi:zinc transport system substrate-binding protein
VVASVYPMAYFAERIGGDDVHIVTLIGTGVNVHGFEPTPGDIRALGEADVAALNGLDLEPWFGRAIDALGDDAPATVVVASGSGLPSGDPHAWLDPVAAQTQVGRIRDALVAADPGKATAYQERAAGLLADLRMLDEAFATTLAVCMLDHVVTTHAAYGRLAERYGFEQLAIANAEAEGDASPQRLAEIVDTLSTLATGYVLVEPALSERLAAAVARETGAALLPIHPIASVTDVELAEVGDYLALMRANLQSLRTAMVCE